MKTAGGVPENLENRLRTIEDQLTIMSDDMREVLNALGELSATVAQIKKALKL
jgi:Mg2+ and Co2+ transporter CorA